MFLCSSLLARPIILQSERHSFQYFSSHLQPTFAKFPVNLMTFKKSDMKIVGRAERIACLSRNAEKQLLLLLFVRFIYYVRAYSAKAERGRKTQNDSGKKNPYVGSNVQDPDRSQLGT